MCGVAGIWHRDGRPAEERALRRMNVVLRHRGPDDEGIVCDGEIGFGHRRLAIVDLSSQAHQPMATEDGRFLLTFNGEIHNYLELRAALESKGIRFRSESDTEVVLEAWRAWGPACLPKFNGMWAFALWDRDRRRLLLSRDRFGIKPLYYSVRGPRIAFASEAKAILAAFPDERRPNLDEIRAFLCGGSPDAGTATFFENVRTVEPATLLGFARDAEPERSVYWTIDPSRTVGGGGAAEEFRELLADAVRIRLRSDVPVGVCLSGGLDSSSILRLASPLVADPVQCFSVRYEDRRYDESRFARLAADPPARADIHWVDPDPTDLVSTLERIVWHHDAPTPIRGRYPQWFTFREAGKHVRVVLDGQGGDELLAGYRQFAMAGFLDALRTPNRRGTLGIRALRNTAVLLSQANGSRAARAFLLAAPIARRFRLEPPMYGRTVHPDLLSATRAGTAQQFRQAWLRRDVDRPFAGPLANALWHDFRHAGLPELLHAEDALSMVFSLESRTPFLDHRLVEFCFGLPSDMKVRDGWTKFILRTSMEGVLPPEVQWRRDKKGFPAPMADWMRRPQNLEDLCALLLDPVSLSRGYLQPTVVRRFLRDFEQRRTRWIQSAEDLLWRWTTLELWSRRFIDTTRGGDPGHRGLNRMPGEARVRHLPTPGA